MSGEHGEPWRVDLDGYIVDRIGEDTGEIYLDKKLKRAIACVNALDGVSTEDVEAGAVKELVKAARAVAENSDRGEPWLKEALKPFEEMER